MVNRDLQEGITSYSSCGQNGEKGKTVNTNLTSYNTQLFASLADYDIFYRWKRTYSNYSMTNHNRKTRTADKKAPIGINNESNDSTVVRHFIILRPTSNTSKDKEIKGSQLTGKTHFIVAHLTYLVI